MNEVPYREVPDRPWLGFLGAGAVIVMAGLLGWETLARSMHHVPGNYDDMSGEAWSVERRKLDDRQRNVRVALTGSSRMLWAADLDILEAGLGTRPVQLALAGTSPRIVVENLVNTTDFDGLILVGYTPYLFNDASPGFLGSVAIDAHELASPSRRIGHWIHGRLSDWLAFIDESFDLFPLLAHYTSLPDREGAYDLSDDGWKLGDMHADRQTDMWPPVEDTSSFDNRQILDFWEGGMGDPPPVPDTLAQWASDTNAFFEPLLAEMRSRGGDIVFIRMPSAGRYRDREIEGNVDTNLWNPLVESLDALSINGWDYPALSTDLEIPEWSHLSRQSQDDWSRAVVPILVDRYVEFRGRALNDMLGIAAPGS